MRDPSIEEHAFLSNTRTAALTRPDGTMNWLCLPTFASGAVFASLLGTPSNGFWRVGPAMYTSAPPESRRRYVGDTLTVEQTWDTGSGVLEVTDFLPAPDASGDAPPTVVRVATCRSGMVRLASEFQPRLGYGSVTPGLQYVGHGTPRLRVTAGSDTYWLDGPRHSADRGSASCDMPLKAGQSIVFALTWTRTGSPAPARLTGTTVLEETQRYWTQWASACTYDGPHRDAVLRSALTLKGLCDVGGAAVAAPTTSLPAPIGGERNWDYRHTWPRDTAWMMQALLSLGYTEEPTAYRNWLTTHIDPDGPKPLYSLDGGPVPAEETLPHLSGYRGSTPVRVGNAAAEQHQLDVYGELADLLAQMDDADIPPCPDADRLLLAIALNVEALWEQPDDGMWESRGTRRRYVSSLVWAWVALDRAARVLERHGAADEETLLRLATVAGTVHAEVCAKGYDAQRNTFTQYFGSQDLDASLLHIARVGFLPPDDKRVIGTVEAVERELSVGGGLLLRYPTHADAADNVDGLAGHEGAFLATAFWMVEALALIGRGTDARELLDRLLSVRSDLGLLAEQYDPAEEVHLGNYPQGLSHDGLIRAVLAINTQGSVPAGADELVLAAAES
ncbi:glycoside hydrolase family 15 protein [Streptomyces sp. FH025]|uniref:glycoside hydrolase family 15 protein n=1 Tax=Streptomyces sp. FH025 TaxID=2815937 RepID=UPI001A9D640C|nr:glycoside hydrolase family 15 protein [Streptomyces sp. FH025]MBO1413229.1 glycoside hydrolase family 15 protein [Streptomyces sp. FH025]